MDQVPGVGSRLGAWNGGIVLRLFVCSQGRESNIYSMDYILLGGIY